jgi:pimeloyl-ACP methyl ester carboxylesterase
VQPDTRYTRSGDVNIAYQVVGEGPLDLVFVPGFLSHLDIQWTDPGMTRLLGGLSSFARVIAFDKRGTGLSDPVGAAPTLEERMDDVRAVMDAAGSERAALFGLSEGGPMSLLFAAAHPERTAALVLFGTFAVGTDVADDNPGGAVWRDVGERMVEAIGHWGEGRTLQLFGPNLASSETWRRVWGRFERAALSPAMARALWQLVSRIDVRHVLPAIRVPTLVVRRSQDFMPIALSRQLAEQIPGARFVELEGDHLPQTGDVEAIVEQVREFLTGMRGDASLDRVLATVLFTDIVGSTERAAALGDRAWRALLDAHHEVARREVARFRGREIDFAGDGMLATFDGPARAIRCALTIADAVRAIGLDIRAGLHTGEIELAGDAVRGIAVHIGARVAAKGEAGEVLVSSTVKDLVSGSGIRFADRGAHVLKGVPGEWRLYRAAA